MKGSFKKKSLQITLKYFFCKVSISSICLTIWHGKENSVQVSSGNVRNSLSLIDLNYSDLIQWRVICYVMVFLNYSESTMKGVNFNITLVY